MICKGSSHSVGALLCVLLVALLVSAGAVQAQVAASIVFATGGALVQAADGTARRAERGGQVLAGETVDTLDGRVQLRFLDGASMSLQAETRFRVDQFRFADQGGKASPEDRGFFSLLKGGFRTVTGLIGKQRREQYRIDTAVATIGIRGTDYLVALSAPLPEKQEASPQMNLSTASGIVEVCNQAGCLLVSEGQSAVVISPVLKPVLASGPGGAAQVGAPDAVVPKLPEVQVQPIQGGINQGGTPQGATQQEPPPGGGTYPGGRGY